MFGPKLASIEVPKPKLGNKMETETIVIISI